MGVAHVAFELHAGYQRRDAVNDDYVERAAAYQVFDDLQRLLGRIRLRDEERVDLDAAACRVGWVQGVFHVDVGSGPTQLLTLSDDVVAEGGLARRLRAENLGDAAFGDAPDAERKIQGDAAGGNGVHFHALVHFAQPHDGAMTKLSFNLAESQF